MYFSVTSVLFVAFTFVFVVENIVSSLNLLLMLLLFVLFAYEIGKLEVAVVVIGAGDDNDDFGGCLFMLLFACCYVLFYYVLVVLSLKSATFTFSYLPPGCA